VDGEVINFVNQAIDHAVTPNHQVWVRRAGKDKRYRKVRADEVLGGYRFKACAGWDGVRDETVRVGSRLLPLDAYMKLVGLYLSEGAVEFWKKRPVGVNFAQTQLHKKGLNKNYAPMKRALEGLYSVTERQKEYASGWKGGFRIYGQDGRDLAAHLLLTYGHGCGEKSLPAWVKAYDAQALHNLLEGFRMGDGADLPHESGSYELMTVSKRLADDLQEVAFKCGFATIVGVRKRPAPRRLLYRVKVFCSDQQRCFEPRVSRQDIKRVPYKGWVYCFEVPNHLFVMRRNGKIVLTGNTYSNAVVAYDILQQRYVHYRNILAEWLKKKLFRPVSEAQGFYEYEKGEKKLVVPDVSWNKMNLQQDNEYRKFLMDLNEKEKVSDRTMLYSLQLDVEEERKLIQEEKEMTPEEGAPELSSSRGPSGGGGGGGIGGPPVEVVEEAMGQGGGSTAPATPAGAPTGPGGAPPGA